MKQRLFQILTFLCIIFLPLSANAAYLHNGDGTITDTSTGLIWEQYGDGVEYGSLTEAANRITELNNGPWTTWRIPHKMELEGISDYMLSVPSFIYKAFWTLETCVYYFSNGPSYPSCEAARVLAVRSPTYTITSTSGANGTISSTVTVNHGSSSTFTMTPNTGYLVADVLVDGTSVGAVTTYTFTNVTAEHTIAVTFTISPPVIQVIHVSLSFGYVPVVSTRDLSFTVKNAGGGTLTGNVSTAAPFSIVSGVNYSLGADQSQVVIIRYQPTSQGPHTGTVVFTGGDGATIQVTGKTEKPRGLPWLLLLLGN